MDSILVGFLALCALLLFLPLDLMWRLALVPVLVRLLERLINGPVHWSDQGFGYTFGLLIINAAGLTIAALVVLRLLVAAVRRRLTVAALIGPDEAPRHFFDAVIWIVLGGGAALLSAQALANGLGGTRGGQVLDLAIFALALVTAIAAAAYMRGGPGVFALTLFLGLAAIAGYGAGQTGRILAGAKTFAGDAPWCLTTGRRAQPITSSRQLGFFSLQKAEFGWHLVVLAREGATLRAAQWSIRSQEFVPTNLVTSLNGRACHPRADYAKVLENG